MGFQDRLEAIITKARKSGKMLVMISYVDEKTEILQHNTLTQNFPVGDFERSVHEHSKHLRGLAKQAEIDEKARPTSGEQRSEEV